MIPIRLLAYLALMPLPLLVAPDARAEDPATYADRPDEEIGDGDRTFGLLLNPLATAIGVFGGEADFVLGRFAAVAVEGDVYRLSGVTGLALGGGLPVYPLGRVFHGLYLEPRITYARPLSEAIPAVDWNIDVAGVGGTAGWQWTWDYGLSLRVGSGAMYLFGGHRRGLLEGGLPTGPQLVLDGSLGWTF
jgi:hypothetical protein